MNTDFKDIIAIIPARGGSKRVKNKNIKNFAGKPIIEYPIEVAKESNLFDRIIVSTDSKKIAEVALNAGAEVPFIRPVWLADDYTITASVIVHTLYQLETLPSCFCLVYPCTPFIQGKYLKEGLRILHNTRASMVLSVCKLSYPPLWALELNKGKLNYAWPGHSLTRSNDLPEMFQDAVHFYWVDTNKFLRFLNLEIKDSIPVFIPNYLVQDIDTEEDWEMAEIKYAMLKERKLIA